MVRKVDIINGTYTIIELSEEGSTTEEEAKKQMILPVEQTTDTVATE